MTARWRSNNRRAVIRIALVALLGLVPRLASAHAVGTSRGQYALNGRTATASLLFARPELVSVIPELDVDRDGLVSERELRDATPALTDAIVRHITMGTDVDHCQGSLDEVRLVEGDGLSVRATYRCDNTPPALTATLGFLDLMAHGHRHFAIINDVATEEHIAYAGHAQLALAAPHVWTLSVSQAGQIVRLGAARVAKGYEYALFLIALMLTGGRPRTFGPALFAFVAGQLLALAASGFGGLSPNTHLITPATALAVVYLALENGFVANARGRWIVTLPFGVAYGFAAAGAFGEIPLAPAQLPAALGAFIGGIATAQVASALLILSGRAWLKRIWTVPTEISGNTARRVSVRAIR